MAGTIDIEYIRKSVAYLESVPVGTIIDITRSPTKGKFVEVTKQYIDTWGGFEFNQDYTKIRKIK